MFLLKLLWNKWITPCINSDLAPVAGAFGVLVLVVKMLLMYLEAGQEREQSSERRSEEKRGKRIQNVKVNRTRDESLERHRMCGTLRGPDKPL